MKIESLRIKLKLNIIFSAVLTLSIVIIHSYKFFKEKDYNQDIEKVRSEIINLKQRNTEVESKANDAKKYKEIWKKMSSTKKNMVGIKMDDVNSNLKKLSEKYSIIDPTIKVTLPENINEGLFKRETLVTSFANVSLSYNSYDDIRSLQFIDEFMKTMNGYKIITSLEIKKNKDYYLNDFVTISTGKSEGGVSTKIELYWYIFKS